MSSVFADQYLPRIRVQMRSDWGGGVSANEYSCAHHVTWGPNILQRSASIFNPCLKWLLLYRKEVGSAPDKELFDKASKSKPFTGGKRFDKKKRKPSSASSSSYGDRGGDGDRRRQDKNKKGKRKVKVFNSEGVGPDYKKGSSALRGVKAGRVQKRGDKAGRGQKKGRKPAR
jgi:hypothetical protein